MSHRTDTDHPMSVNDWSYFNPVRVVFSPGALARLADYVPFERAVLITSPGFTRRGLTARIRDILGGKLLAVLDDVKPNPDMQYVDIQTMSLRGYQPDGIVALGGGSSMDTAKAIARMLPQASSTTLTAHLREDVALSATPALPVITIPTTSGSGSEVTPFGTVWDFDRKKKYSLSGSDLYAYTALLDPELTTDLPADVTISSGLDAISHALESAWNRNASPVTLGLVATSLRLSLEALAVLKERSDDVGMRGAMMQASVLAGIAISQTRTALAHSISYPLTMAFGLPHGIACSFTLPALLRFNAQGDDGRLDGLARAVGYADVESLATELSILFRHLQVHKLFWQHVPNGSAVMELSGNMFVPERANNNMREVYRDDLIQILRDSIVLMETSEG